MFYISSSNEIAAFVRNLESSAYEQCIKEREMNHQCTTAKHTEQVIEHNTQYNSTEHRVKSVVFSR